MVHVDLEILHSLQGRLRIKLDKGFVDAEAAKRYITVKGVSSTRYNARIKTLLVCYEGLNREEAIARIAAVYANQHSLDYVHVTENPERETGVSSSGKIALVAIGINTFVQWYMPLSRVVSVAKWCAVGATVGAIIEHGYDEISKRGTFDPEVMSVVYLLNAASRNQTLYATPGVWLLTFGRHLLANHNMDVMLKVTKADDADVFTVKQMKSVIGHERVSFAKEALHRFLSVNVWGKATK